MLRAASLLALSLLVTLVVACGGGSSSGGDDLAAYVPADAMFYAEAAVRPEGGLREDALAAAGKVLRTDDPSGKIRQFVDMAFESDGDDVDYARDIEPWLGERVAAWGSRRHDEQQDSPGMGAIVESPDAAAGIDKLREFAEEDGQSWSERSHGGVDYQLDDEGTAYGVVDDFLVVAMEPEFKAMVDTAEGDSLADADRYQQGRDALEDDTLGHFYADVGALVELGARSEPNGEEQLRQVQAVFPFDKLGPLMGSFSADADRLALDMTIDMGEAGGSLPGLTAGGSTPLVEELPAESWLAFGAADYGTSIKEALDAYAGALGGAVLQQQLRQEIGLDLEQDLLSWIGDVAVFVRGTTVNDVDGGLVIEATDAERARNGFGKIVGAMQRSGGAQVEPVDVEGAEDAFAIRDGDTPQPVVLARSAERVVVAYGEAAATDALEPGETLGDSETFAGAGDALGGDFEPAFLVSMPAIIELVDSLGAAGPEFAEVRPYLEAYDVIAGAGESDDNRARLRVAAGLK